MDECRCCRWIRSLALSFYVLSFALPANAYGSAQEAQSAKSAVESFISWFEPKVRAVLEESTGIVADRLPIKLAMAQAALESGWGKSKAAVKRKNFFGLMRKDGKPMSFDTAEESIRFYVKTLTEHKAYAGFRKRLGTTDSPEALANELRAYSEHPSYPAMLHSIIRSDKLSYLDAPVESLNPGVTQQTPRGSESSPDDARALPSGTSHVEMKASI